MSIIRIDDLTFAYEGAPEPVFRGLTLELDDTWKLALTGRNGRGKTTLLKLLSGELDARGRIHAAARFARFPFAVEDASLPARAAMATVCGAEDWRIEREAGRIGLDEGALDRPLNTLSGGERMKALLSALFLIEGCVPLIDEPTNHLDAAAFPTTCASASAARPWSAPRRRISPRRRSSSARSVASRRSRSRR